MSDEEEVEADRMPRPQDACWCKHCQGRRRHDGTPLTDEEYKRQHGIRKKERLCWCPHCSGMFQSTTGCPLTDEEYAFLNGHITGYSEGYGDAQKEGGYDEGYDAGRRRLLLETGAVYQEPPPGEGGSFRDGYQRGYADAVKEPEPKPESSRAEYEEYEAKVHELCQFVQHRIDEVEARVGSVRWGDDVYGEPLCDFLRKIVERYGYLPSVLRDGRETNDEKLAYGGVVCDLADAYLDHSDQPEWRKYRHWR